MHFEPQAIKKTNFYGLLKLKKRERRGANKKKYRRGNKDELVSILAITFDKVSITEWDA